MNLWPSAWTGLRNALLSVWTDIPVEKIYRVRNVAGMDFKQLVPPLAIVEIPPTEESSEWGGCCNQAYVPRVTFFRVDDVTGGADSDAAMEAQLSALEDWLRVAGNLANGQVIEVHPPDVSLNNRINAELEKAEIARIGGALMADILYFKP